MPELTNRKPYDLAHEQMPIPCKAPRRLTEQESRDWGLEGLAEKIPEGVFVTIIGTKKVEP